MSQTHSNCNKNQSIMSSLNIEKSILSSIFYDSNLLDDIKYIISSNNFINSEYKKIYSTMLELHSADIPIDEIMVLSKSKNTINADIIPEILATTPLTNIAEYAKELKKANLSQQIYLLTIKLQEKFDIELIEQMNALKLQIEEIDGIRKLKLEDDRLFNFFEKLDLDFDEVDRIKFEYLYDDLLVKNEITMLSSLPGVGKSLISVHLCDHLLKTKKIKQLFYLDGDNGLSTIKDRNIHHYKLKYGNQFRYFVGKSRSELKQIIQKLQQMNLEDTLIVFDSIKNFIDGDRDKNKDVSIVMETLKSLRNNGATVLFLHHQNKKQKDFNSDFAGSSAFAEDTTNAIRLEFNKDKETFILTPFKARAGHLEEIALKLDNSNLVRVDVEFAKQTAEDEEMIIETIEFIKSSYSQPIWSDLWKNLIELGYNKEKASKIIKAGEGKIWNFKRGDRNNQKVYFLIDEKETIIEYVYQDSTRTTKSTKRSGRSERTPFDGTSKELYNNTPYNTKQKSTQSSGISERSGRTPFDGGFDDLYSSMNDKNMSLPDIL